LGAAAAPAAGRSSTAYHTRRTAARRRQPIRTAAPMVARCLHRQVGRSSVVVPVRCSGRAPLPPRLPAAPTVNTRAACSASSAPSGLPRARGPVPARVLGWPCPPRARALHLRADGRARARPRLWSQHALTWESSVAQRGRRCSGRMLHSPLRGLFRIAPPHCHPRCAPSHLRCKPLQPVAAWSGRAHRPFPDASGGTNGTGAAPLASVACRRMASGRPRQPAARSAVGPGLSHALARSLARSTAPVPLVPPLAFLALPCACAGGHGHIRRRRGRQRLLLMPAQADGVGRHPLCNVCNVA